MNEKKKKANRESDKTLKNKEKLTQQDIDELMGIRRPIYCKRRGVIRQR